MVPPSSVSLFAASDNITLVLPAFRTNEEQSDKISLFVHTSPSEGAGSIGLHPLHTYGRKRIWAAHKCYYIKTEFGVEELEWLAQSPDLNPIERFWDELERRLRASVLITHQCLIFQKHGPKSHKHTQTLWNGWGNVVSRIPATVVKSCHLVACFKLFTNTSYTSCRIWVYYPTIVVSACVQWHWGQKIVKVADSDSRLSLCHPPWFWSSTIVSETDWRPVLSVPISQFRVVLSRNNQVIRLLVESENMNWEWVYVNHISYKIKRTLLVQDVSHLMSLQSNLTPGTSIVLCNSVVVWAAK